MLAGGGLAVAPGAYDCITARAVQTAGFKAVYMTGAGTSATLGYPDYGLLTMREMVDNAARLVAAVDIPVIADADAGYGNELNVYRTVMEYEQAGVAGIHIEDQEDPKRCGHLDDKRIIPQGDYIAKIRAALAARKNPDFVIIARTDARAVTGLDDAIQRARAALAAGADIAFVEAPQDLEELRLVPERVNGPCLVNIVWKGKTPDISLDEAQAMGFKLALLPGLLLKSVVQTCDQVLHSLKEIRRYPPPHGSGDITPSEGFRRFGAGEWDGIRQAVEAATFDR
ncbi:carboxyvinyl-carboxyphosphonate phosphorylmutase [Alcanivorax balearicus MACL04]|uniref:Carboxyvinyl-carboxyphosphonate phosphorylmutase n=2 Tax=Alcanivoracaceae TaxID=224372 RepID=A0ABT2R430_9GAMM|nr:carboxyvinyl-carboxyphosphonate phosphorylmutase [Alloalcanivorax balearicus MACL04]